MGQPRVDDTVAVTRPRLRWTLLSLALVALIVGPFLIFGSDLESWSADALRSASEYRLWTAGLVVLLLGADVLLPVPSSLVSTLAGVVLGLVRGAGASFLGMTLGGVIGYGIGATAGKGAATRVLGARELSRLEVATRRFGDWTIVLTRAVPVLAEASTVFAGMGSMRFGRFLAFMALSNLGISLVYAAVGAYAAEVQSFFLALAGAVLVPLIAAALVGRLRKHESG